MSISGKSGMDLIDTQWNVNTFNYIVINAASTDLIDTQWNVNKIGIIDVDPDIVI